MRVAFIVKPFKVELLGIAYLASSLKGEGHEVILVRTDNIQRLDRFNPDVLAYSVTTGQHKFYLNLNYQLKRRFKGVVSVFGGPHATYFPEMVGEPGVDVVIQGEAEDSLAWFLNRPHHRGVIKPWVLNQKLDTIPFPDRDFLYTYEENRRNPIKNVMTSRGCPYTCPYCYNSVYRNLYKGQRWTRFREVESIIAECIQVRDIYEAKFIFFQDDEFSCHPSLRRLLVYYQGEVGIPFHCQIRIERMTRSLAYSLKDSGCHSVTFAIECGDEVYRRGILKRKVSNDKIIAGAKILREAGLLYRTENMVGLPGEIPRLMMKTVLLNRRVKPTIGWCSIFQPYPNLPLSEMAKELGEWDGQLNMRNSFFEDTVLKTNYRNQIINFQRLFGLFTRYPIPERIMWAMVNREPKQWYDKVHREVKRNGYKKLFKE